MTEEPAPRSRASLKWVALTAVAFFTLAAWWGGGHSTRRESYTCVTSGSAPISDSRCFTYP